VGHKTTTVLVFLVFYTFCNFCTIYFVGVNFLSAPERPETETETRRALNYNVYKKDLYGRHETIGKRFGYYLL